MDMPIVIQTLIVLVLILPGIAQAKEYAKPGEGVRPNQRMIRLEDGTFFAREDKKVVSPGVVLTPKERIENHNRTIRWLNQFRYWAGGVPPEKTALERFLEQMEKRREQQQFYESLLQENWSRTRLFSDHADSPGISKPYRRK
jgi:hypothetical protein